MSKLSKAAVAHCRGGGLECSFRNFSWMNDGDFVAADLDLVP
jgi:hypothetical protein